MNTLTLFLGAEQSNLPGLESGIPPRAGSALQATIDRALETLSEVRCPGQLCLDGETQPELTGAEPAPKQLPLLPDPPLWEVLPSPPPKIRRSPQPPRARKLSKGQLSLF